MDNEVKELLMQLVDTTNKLSEGQKQLFEGQKQLFEGQKQLFEGQKQTNERLDKIDKQLDEHYNMIHQIVLNQDKMSEKMMSMQKDISSIKVTLENDVSPSIKNLYELHIDTSNRVHNIEKDVEEVKDELAINDVIQGLKENNMI